MGLEAQECVRFFMEEMSAWVGAAAPLLNRSVLSSLPLWIAAALAGTVLVAIFALCRKLWAKLSAEFLRFPTRELNSLVQSRRTPDAHVIQDQVVTDSSKKSKKCKLACCTIQIDDLVSFYQKLHYKDCGPPWEFLTERSIQGMTYQAWRRDPQEGPTEYRTRFVFEDVTPQMMRDFLWDDERRHEWDNLIKSAKCVEGCFDTGESITHWVKKFPFFCSDREYVMVRQIYECEGTFYCITKAAAHKEILIKKKPLRIQVYSSNWCIQAVDSPQTGQMTSCKVTFLHSEDLLIQRDLAKLGVRRAMWPLVKRMEPGLRKYQVYSKSSTSPSTSALIAKVCTKVPPALLDESSTARALTNQEKEKVTLNQGHLNACKLVVISGVVLLACGLCVGPVGRVLVLSVAKGLGRFKRRR